MRGKSQQHPEQEPARQSFPSRVSDLIDLRRFERENRRRLYRGFGYAALVLALVVLLWHPRFFKVITTPETPYRIIKTDIIEMPIQHYSEPYQVRRPSLTMPLPLSRLKSGIRLPSRGIATKRAPFPGEEQALAPIEPEIESVPVPDTSLQKQSFFPPPSKYETRITRQYERHFSLEEEGLTLDALDSLGVYKALIISDPTDKKKVKGFAHIPSLVLGIPTVAARLEDAIPGLIETANPFCDIEFRADPPILLSSPRLFQYPVVYFTSAADSVFELSPVQILRFGEYLRQGGFAIVDNGAPMYDFSPAEASLLNILIKLWARKYVLNGFRRIIHSSPAFSIAVVRFPPA
jgi:hypothetical protein